jgi:hypothetical protein
MKSRFRKPLLKSLSMRIKAKRGVSKTPSGFGPSGEISDRVLFADSALTRQAPITFSERSSQPMASDLPLKYELEPDIQTW